MKVSFIIPVYNIKHLMSDGRLRCFEKLLSLVTDEKYEIIAVDDCSPDGSYEDVLLKYQNRYPDKFVAIKSDANHRAGGARNRGIQAARGEWISFVDQDDWVTEDFMEKLLLMAESTGADMVGCYWNVKRHVDDSIEKVEYNRLDGKTGILDKSKYEKLIIESGGLLAHIFKKEVIEKASVDGKLFPEDMMYEDNAVSSFIMLAATHYEFVPEPLYYYCSAEDSVSSVVTKQAVKDRLKAAVMVIERAKKDGSFKEYHDAYEYSFVLIYYLNTFLKLIKSNWSYGDVVRLVCHMQKQMNKLFPKWQENHYYKELTSKKMQLIFKLQQYMPWLTVRIMRIRLRKG